MKYITESRALFNYINKFSKIGVSRELIAENCPALGLDPDLAPFVIAEMIKEGLIVEKLVPKRFYPTEQLRIFAVK